MFKELILSSIISTSVSIKTSNDDTKKHDYEYMFQIEKDADDFSYLLKRDWERELGEKYIDNVIKLNYVIPQNVYFGFDYIDKESKDIDYKTFNVGYKLKFGLQTGLSIKHEKKTTTLLHLQYQISRKKNDMEYIFFTSLKSDLSDENIYNMKTEVKHWINDNINIFMLYKHLYFNEKDDYQFRIGTGVKL